MLEVGEALTDVTSATIDAALETVRADSDAAVPRIAVSADHSLHDPG